jgi:anti-sigma factor ChrR (cupin superfamily)
LSRVDRAFLDGLIARVRRGEIAWEPFRPGVDLYRVWGDPEGAWAALLRYAPGATVPDHEHTGVENIYVLEGSQRDDRGVHRAGDHVVNQPGSIHNVESDDGCLVLVVWESPNRFLAG